MKNFLLLTARSHLFFLLFLSIQMFAQPYADAIVGKWISQDKRTVVEVSKNSTNNYIARIDKIRYPIDPETNKPKTDTKNPDPAMRGRPLIGLQVLHQLNYKDGYWQNGKIYNTVTGKSYDCDVWLEKPDKLKMKAYWYFLSHTELWTRVE